MEAGLQQRLAATFVTDSTAGLLLGLKLFPATFNQDLPPCNWEPETYYKLHRSTNEFSLNLIF